MGSKALKALALIYHDIVASGEVATGFPGPRAGRYKLTWHQFEPTWRRSRTRAGRPSRSTIPDKEVGQSARADLRRRRRERPRVGQRLAELGWPGYFFVISDYIGSPSFLDADGIRDLRAVGHFDRVTFTNPPGADLEFRGRQLLMNGPGAKLVCRSSWAKHRGRVGAGGLLLRESRESGRRRRYRSAFHLGAARSPGRSMAVWSSGATRSREARRRPHQDVS